MIDSHCHLNFKELSENFQNIINNSKLNNITSMLTINTDPKDFEDHLNLIKNYNFIYLSFGLHPDKVELFNQIQLQNFDIACKNEKVIAIGETGIDLYHSHNQLNEQTQVFETHIQASIKHSLPLIIHQRNSEKEIIDILKHYKSNNLKLVFHCFTGSHQLLNFCLDNNYYISLSGIITFKNASNLRDVIKNAPLKSILIETDSPFLAPEPMRGKINEPSYVKYTAEYLSSFFNISLEEFEKITDNNFFNLFTRAKRDNYL
tara:strand:- start:23 stop:805 length:783 start_codon:yes stop_codon:yes gene_type:complete